MGWRATDSKKFEELMKFAINPLGAVIVGVTAGLGEELFTRGVLQPRLGILLLEFILHRHSCAAIQLGRPVECVSVGLILGVIRQKTNTTTSAIVHGTYDFVLIMLAYWGGSP